MVSCIFWKEDAGQAAEWGEGWLAKLRRAGLKDKERLECVPWVRETWVCICPFMFYHSLHEKRCEWKMCFLSYQLLVTSPTLRGKHERSVSPAKSSVAFWVTKLVYVSISADSQNLSYLPPRLFFRIPCMCIQMHHIQLSIFPCCLWCINKPN